jgi:endonuclease-3 related protein
VTPRARDLPDDPGLAPTPFTNERGPYVGRAPRGRIRRFAHDPRLDAVLRELYRGFGPQRWWPAATPFEVMVGAILTQNTAWSNVELALANLRRKSALTPARLLNTRRGTLEEWIRPSGYFRAKAEKLRALAAWYLDAGGLTELARRPLGPLRADLLGVHGVGPETADSILCYALGRRVAVVDAYTRRVLGRHGLLDPELPYEEVRSWLEERLVRSQAVYEEFHALCVRVGAHNCRPNPTCETCPATTPNST